MRTNTRKSTFVAALVLSLAFAASLPCMFARTDEKAEAREWVAAKFEGVIPAEPAVGYMIVRTASGRVLKNGIQGHNFRIVDRTYPGGINQPQAGAITVHLPSPGRAFEAVVGVDSNDVGYYSNRGRGSVVASIQIGGNDVFSSAVMHEGVPGVAVKTELGGAREFTLSLKAVGERKPWESSDWDQADWANASVTLTDGSTIALADLPIGPLRSGATVDPPFSFRYEGQSSTGFLKTWTTERNSKELDANRTEHTLIYRDPKTKLEVRAVAIEYRDFPTVEWTLYFRNAGPTDTPILEDIRALDTRFERNAEGEFLLHHGKGSPASATDYEPLETALPPKTSEHIAAAGGRPTNSDLCYFNLEWPGEGVVIALGWPGQWAAEFQRDEGRGLTVRAGQELTHFKLLPGEEVRTPLVVLQFWRGEWIGAQNTWRRWMIAHNLPRPGGHLPPPQVAVGSGRYTIEMQGANEENQKQGLELFLQKGFKPDYWWMDAGWYPFKSHWYNTGTWENDPTRFPHGLRAVSDYAGARGVKTLVWFEPERVAPGSWLYENHAEWLLGADGKDKLLNLGNADAWHWLVERVSQILTEQRIGLYRQDFNFDPLDRWRSADAPDRQGITEIRHVTGYLAYWDELRRRFPDMLIDTCASGGRRNDLETLRRAVPLWRSDYPYEPTAMQDQTYGMALWIPYFGSAINSDDSYVFRSQMTPAVGVGIEPDSVEIDYPRYLGLLARWKQIAANYYGDFYPLTSYNTSNDVWMAWQYDRPEAGEGVVQAFRRPESPFDSARFKLHGLDASSQYDVRDVDNGQTSQMSGRELMDAGLPVSIAERPGAVIVTYARAVTGNSR